MANDVEYGIGRAPVSSEILVPSDAPTLDIERSLLSK